jgi:hypothetical protein
MPSERAPEFSLQSPLASALAVIRGVLFSPSGFYRDFEADGPIKEPALFVLLVGAVTGALGAAVGPRFQPPLRGARRRRRVVGVAGRPALRAALSALCGVAAGFYLLALKAFVGKVGRFEEVYRIAAYAFGAMILFWIPIVGAFAVTYAFMVLVGIGIHSVYRTPFITTVVVALSGFVPVATALIFVTTLG